MRIKLVLKTTYQFALVSSLVLLMFSYANAQSQESVANQDYRLRLTNRTQLFEVIEVNTKGKDITLRLKNGYEKSIIDFKIALPRPLGKDGMVIDYVGEPVVIAPGSTYEYKFSLPPSHLEVQNEAKTEREVVIAAVVFDDRTGDGDREKAATMVAERLGERIQVSRILPLLQGVLELPDSDLQRGLESLKSQVAALSRDPSGESEAIEILRSKYENVFERQKDNLIGEIGTGLYFGQGKFLVRIRELEKQVSEKSDASLRRELKALRQEYEKALSSL